MRTLIFLLVLAVGGFFWHRRHEKYLLLESLQTEAKSKDALAADKEKQLKTWQAKVALLREGEAELNKPDGSPEQLEKDVLALRAELTAGAAKLESAEDDYLAVVNEVREEGKKEVFPVLKLSNGEELKSAHISGFGEGFVKVAHDDGNLKLMLDDLPAGWAEKYDVDYVSRHSKEENLAMSARVQEAVLTPLDLKKAKLSEIDDRIKAVTDQLMAYSGHIRESRRQEDELVRKAYRISMGSGPGGASVVNKRDVMFKQAKELAKQREGTRLQYVALRKQKELLERQRLLIKKAPFNPPPAP
jgi:hypothetical protein